MTTKILKVMLWGREVGRLCVDPRRHLPYFEYNREWIESGLDISPLDASIKQPQNLRPIFGASEKIYQKLPPFWLTHCLTHGAMPYLNNGDCSRTSNLAKSRLWTSSRSLGNGRWVLLNSSPKLQALIPKKKST